MRLNVEGLNRPTGLQPERTAFPTKLDRRLGRRGFLIAGGAALAAAFLPPELRAQEIPPDFDVLGGHFFTQTRGDAPFPQGYLIKDDFYAAFLRMGGVSLNGYPVANEVIIAGLRSQPTQNIILQDNRELGFVPANTLDIAHDMGLDNFLYARGIPRKSTEDDGSDGDIAKATQVRLTWLTQPHIRDKYFQNPIAFFGLPTSRPEKIGPAIAQRFQRSAIMTVVEEAEGWPPVGTTLLMNVPDLLKQAGFFGPAAIPIDNPYGAGSGGGNGGNGKEVINGTESPYPIIPASEITFPKDYGQWPEKIADINKYGWELINHGQRAGALVTDFNFANQAIQRHIVESGYRLSILIYNRIEDSPAELWGGKHPPGFGSLRGVSIKGCEAAILSTPFRDISRYVESGNIITGIFIPGDNLSIIIPANIHGTPGTISFQEVASRELSSQIGFKLRQYTKHYPSWQLARSCEENLIPDRDEFNSRPIFVFTQK